MHRSIVPSIALVLAGLLLAGCQSNRSAAAALAATGHDVASTCEEGFRATRDQLDLLIDREIMRAALTPSLPPPTDSMKASIAAAQKAYGIRAQLFGDLQAFYAAMSDLAAYDASAEVSGATSELTSAANGFAAAIGQSAPFTDAAAGTINALAGAVATAAQNKKLDRANELAIALLPPIIGLLEAERAVHASVFQTMGDIETQTALVLFGQGVGAPDGVLEELLGQIGLTYDAKAAAAAFKNSAQLRQGVEDVLRNRGRRRQTASDDIATTAIRALERQLAEHKKYDTGAAVDLQTVTSQLANIRASAEQLGASIAQD